MSVVKVSIALSVDSNGDWCCAGWKGSDGEDARSYTIDALEDGEAHYILEAEVEIPEKKKIKAKVTKAL